VPGNLNPSNNDRNHTIKYEDNALTNVWNAVQAGGNVSQAGGNVSQAGGNVSQAGGNVTEAGRNTICNTQTEVDHNNTLTIVAPETRTLAQFGQAQHNSIINSCNNNVNNKNIKYNNNYTKRRTNGASNDNINNKN